MSIPTQAVSHQGRLQREPTASGYRVASFADVLRRHGLLMGGIALLCLLTPGAPAALAATTQRLVTQPWPYVAAVAGLLVFFVLWSRRRRVEWSSQTLWTGYLLYISVVEEIAFRLIIPSLLAPHLGLIAAHVASNLLFACIHYFTLRWKLRNCVFTFFGGMGLSQLMIRGDLALVVLVHWLGTFLNTPFPPSGQRAPRPR